MYFVFQTVGLCYFCVDQYLIPLSLLIINAFFFQYIWGNSLFWSLALLTALSWLPGGFFNKSNILCLKRVLYIAKKAVILGGQSTCLENINKYPKLFAYWRMLIISLFTKLINIGGLRRVVKCVRLLRRVSRRLSVKSASVYLQLKVKAMK